MSHSLRLRTSPLSIPSLSYKSKEERVRRNDSRETKKLALDCEMVELDGAINGLARVSVVNYYGHILLDSLVKPPRGTRITDYRTKYSGITPKLMWGSPSQLITTHEEALLKTKRLLKDAVVIGHSLWNDFAALEYDSHP